MNVLPLQFLNHCMSLITDSLRHFGLKLSVFAAFWVLLGLILSYFGNDVLHPHWVLLLVYNVLVNLSCYWAATLILKKFAGDPQAATFGLLTAVSAHFILHLFFLLAYYIVAGKFELVFVLHLLVFYASFLVFELVSLLNILRPLSNEHK